MPRRFSSSRRSASIPVSAFTSAVLPWSICPAVPTMMDFIWLKSYRKQARPQIFAVKLGNDEFQLLPTLPFLQGLQNATIELPHDHLHDFCLPCGDPPAAWAYAGRVRENQAASGTTRAYAHRTGHLQRDVERALLLQIVAGPPKAAAYPQQACAARPGRERRHYRHWRRMGLRLQDRVAQSPVLHRTISR